jgi:hypothetical protein
MEHPSDVFLSEPNITPEAELTRLVQALTILPSEQREALLRILSTASGFEALQAELAAHPDLKVALEHCSMNTAESLKCKQDLDQLSTPFVPGKCSDLTEWVCLGQQSHTLREGIEPLSHPGAKEAGQTHASR